MARYTPEELQKILDNVSLVDYFYHLESQGRVKFDKKYEKDYYFISENGKYSVTDDGFYDFKSGKGGQIIKDVMEFENKSWKEAVDFLKDFGNTTINADFKRKLTERRIRIDKISKETKSETKIIRSIVPNNKKLIEYFEDREISKEILKANTKQVHYEVKIKICHNKYNLVNIKTVSLIDILFVPQYYRQYEHLSQPFSSSS